MKMMQFAETLGSRVQVDVASCRSDMLKYYDKLGFIEEERYPAEKFPANKKMTRTGLQMIILRKTSGKQL